MWCPDPGQARKGNAVSSFSIKGFQEMYAVWGCDFTILSERLFLLPKDRWFFLPWRYLNNFGRFVFISKCSWEANLADRRMNRGQWEDVEGHWPGSHIDVFESQPRCQTTKCLEQVTSPLLNSVSLSEKWVSGTSRNSVYSVYSVQILRAPRRVAHLTLTNCLWDGEQSSYPLSRWRTLKHREAKIVLLRVMQLVSGSDGIWT